MQEKAIIEQCDNNSEGKEEGGMTEGLIAIDVLRVC